MNNMDNSYKKMIRIALVWLIIAVVIIAVLVGMLIGRGLNKNTAENTASVQAEELQEEIYQQAEQLLADGEYQEAAAKYGDIEDYQDAVTKKQEALYLYAEQLYDNEDYTAAESAYAEVLDYKDSNEKREECLYQRAYVLYESGKYAKAAELLKNLSTDEGKALYKKITTLQKDIKLYKKAKKQYNAQKYKQSLKTINKVSDYAPAKVLKKKIKKAIKNMPPATPTIYEFEDTSYSAGGDGSRVTVMWDTVSDASGYEYYATQDYYPESDSDPYVENEFTTDLYYETEASDCLKITCKVRAYKMVNGQRKYSEWSRTVSTVMNNW